MSASDCIPSHRDPAGGSAASRCARVALLLVATCGLAGAGAAPTNAAESAPPAAGTQAGEALFATNCAACHAGGDNIIDPSKPVRGSAKINDFETFLVWIRAPKSPMTAFPAEQISEAQARELYRYVVETFARPTAK
jgi:cytochrome c6